MYIRTYVQYCTAAGIYVQYLCILAKIQSACQHPIIPIPSHYWPPHDKNWHRRVLQHGCPVCILTSRRKGTTCSLNTVTSLWYSFSVSIISWITLPLTRGLGVFLSLCSDVGALERQETGHAQGQLGYELSQLNVEQWRERQEKMRVYTNEAMELCSQHIKTCCPCFTVTYSNTCTLVSIMAQLVH